MGLRRFKTPDDLRTHRALVVSRLALALARTIEVVDLRARVDFLEQEKEA